MMQSSSRLPSIKSSPLEYLKRHISTEHYNLIVDFIERIQKEQRPSNECPDFKIKDIESWKKSYPYLTQDWYSHYLDYLDSVVMSLSNESPLSFPKFHMAIIPELISELNDQKKMQGEMPANNSSISNK
jgi:hypothetical protein